MTKKLSDIVITSALRTPIGTYRGRLKELNADKLGSICIREVIKNSKLKADDIEQVVMGQVLTSATGQNPARQASINAGIPVSKPAHIVNQLCGSGLRAVASAYQSVKLKENKIVIAGGQESMSNAPKAINIHSGQKLEEENLIDTMIKDVFGMPLMVIIWELLQKMLLPNGKLLEVIKMILLYHRSLKLKKHKKRKNLKMKLFQQFLMVKINWILMNIQGPV